MSIILDLRVCKILIQLAVVLQRSRADSCSPFPHPQGLRCCYSSLSFFFFLPRSTQRIYRLYMPGISSWNNWASSAKLKQIYFLVLRRLWLLATEGQSALAKKPACPPDPLSLLLQFLLCFIFSSLKFFHFILYILYYSSLNSFLDQIRKLRKLSMFFFTKSINS